MAHTIDEALNNPLISIVKRNDARGMYSFRLGDLEPIITIRLRKLRNHYCIEYKTSHVIKTPCQDAPYSTSIPFGDTPGIALAKAIADFTWYYNEAINEGRSPSDDWLKPAMFWPTLHQQ